MERSITSVVVAFCFVLMGGIATLGWSWWWQERQVCDIRWSKAIEKANKEWEETFEGMRKALVEADEVLALEKEKAREGRKREAELLAKQAQSIPLSDACLKCRVPWERLFLRGQQLSVPSTSQ